MENKSGCFTGSKIGVFFGASEKFGWSLVVVAGTGFGVDEMGIVSVINQFGNAALEWLTNADRWMISTQFVVAVSFPRVISGVENFTQSQRKFTMSVFAATIAADAPVVSFVSGMASQRPESVIASANAFMSVASDCPPRFRVSSVSPT